MATRIKPIRFLFRAVLAVLLGAALGAGLVKILGEDPRPPVESPIVPAKKLKPAPEPVRPDPSREAYRYLGLVVPLSGPLAEPGQSMVRGAEMAVQEANGELENGAKPFGILVEDEAADIPPDGRLANDSRALVVLGHLMERSLANAAPWYRKKSGPVILPVLSGPEITNLGDAHFFRLMPSDADQAWALAEFTRSRLKAQSVWVVFENSDFGRCLAENFVQGLNRENGLRIQQSPYPEQPEVLQNLASEMAQTKPDVVFLAMGAHEAINLVSAMAQSDFKAQCLGTHALALSQVTPVLERLTGKTWLCLPFNPEAPGEAGERFTSAFQNKHHRFPNWLTVMGYTAANLALEAIRQTDGSPGRITAYLNKIDGNPNRFKGLAGDYHFEPQGRGVGPVFIVEVNSGLMGRVP